MTHRLREPVDRVSWISFSLVTAVLAPSALLAFYTPNLNLGIIPIPKEPTPVASVATDPSSVSQLELVRSPERKSTEQKERLALSSHHELLEETPAGRPVVAAQTTSKESEWAEQSETMPIDLATNPSLAPDASMTTFTLRPSGGLKGKLMADQPEWVQNVKIYFRSDELNTYQDPRGVAEVTTNELGEFHVPKKAGDRYTMEIRPEIAATDPHSNLTKGHIQKIPQDANGLFRIAMLPDALLSLTAHLPSSTRVEPRFPPAKIDIAMNQQDIRIVLDPSKFGHQILGPTRFGIRLHGEQATTELAIPLKRKE